MSKLFIRSFFASILIFPLLMIISFAGCSQSNSNNTTFISSFKGDAQIKKAGTNDWIKAGVKTTLEVSDYIKTGTNSQILITFFDGSTIELESDP